MSDIVIKSATANNLKNVSVRIPTGKLVAVVGKSGSGKSSLVYDVLYRASQGQDVKAQVGKLPRTSVLPQRVKPDGKSSLGETNLARLKKLLVGARKGELLIIDEPCAGMTQEDRKLVLGVLRAAVKKGISVIVVEHNQDIIAGADYVIEFGPESGAQGGRVVFQGPVGRFRKAKTPTSVYAFSDQASKSSYERAPSRRTQLMSGKRLAISGIDRNNLKDFKFSFPLSSLVCVSGRMGSGKSTLLSVVYGALFKGRDAWKFRQGFRSVEGKQHVRRSYFVDQSPLSPSSSSTPATYLGIWDAVRDAFAALPESRRLRLTKSDFNLDEKTGSVRSQLARKVRYAGKTATDVLGLTMDETARLFSESPLIKRKVGFLHEVGLGYLTLGQKSNTLSGGEAQRVRLAKILSKKLGDRCVYVFDVPSRGLHLSDLPALIGVFHKIIDKNNTVVIAENREELLKNCDYVVRLEK
jgi:excinuclease ABC subunit A